jgi:hypothetical protein
LAEAARRTNDGRLDFAHFDCLACHHELEVPTRRQPRAGTPGRPPMRPLPAGLMTAVLTLDAERGPSRVTELNQLLRDLESAFVARPYGNPEEIAALAHSLAAKAHAWACELNAVHYLAPQHDALERSIAKVAAQPPTGGWNYDAAQLFVWTRLALVDYEGARAERWQRLRQHTLLRAGLPKSTATGDAVQRALQERLNLRYRFDGEKFQEAWNAVFQSSRTATPQTPK